MSSTATIQYTGNLHTDATHNQSGTVISTDAPIDNGGKGEAFSPTDLVASALASCALTIMGKKATSMGIAYDDIRAEVQKTMSADPRRISGIRIDFYFGHSYDEKTRKILEATAHACPVAKSLSADLEQIFTFHYA